MGAIRSVSLPSHITCRESGCWKKCYANKLECLRPAVREAYQNNLEILQQNPEKYWREVEAAIMVSRFFRFHVSGDIVNPQYFENMVAVASRNAYCEILCFTKKFDIVNKFLYRANNLPPNLHIIYSGWPGLQIDNLYNLPEAHVLFKNGNTTARKDAVLCPGDCTKCAVTNAGCWTLKNGEQVVFYEH